jgi:hypothetical protein
MVRASGFTKNPIEFIVIICIDMVIISNYRKAVDV